MSYIYIIIVISFKQFMVFKNRLMKWDTGTLECNRLNSIIGGLFKNFKNISEFNSSHSIDFKFTSHWNMNGKKPNFFNFFKYISLNFIECKVNMNEKKKLISLISLNIFSKFYRMQSTVSN